MSDSSRNPERDEPLPIVVGVTGASGAIYAQKFVQYVLASGHEVHLAVSPAARLVLREELGEESRDPWGDVHRDRLHIHPDRDFAAPYCSGSFRHRGMVIIPASMGTVGAVAAGVAANGIHRGAEVALKERRPLIVVPRETPLSVIHLENLLRLARAGAVVLPPSPAFYQHPSTVGDLVDFVVSRVLDALGIANELYPRWHGLGASRNEES
jgi:4-hydroxy-3-polyprenylbenzoate decarboxylase